MPGAHVPDAPNPFERAARGRHPAPMKILASLWRWLLGVRTRSELRGLSDRALRDIGLERGQIDRLFR
jgi:uncharacterized protein YjiS (DUF1127 family)